ncbi:MAG: cobalamin-binding protein [Actinomycetales bacterium]|nr:cobalamin-binding protein [Actinomycetales bacterium]
MPYDDLGEHVTPPRPVERVVSLVPSLTEAIASVRADAVVGATDWCTHPPDLPAKRVRGTKNPDVGAIVALAPDLVIANKEENRERDVARLRAAGVPVWVTDIESVDQALVSMARLFEEGLGWTAPGWLGEAREAWSGPVPEPRLRAATAIWRDPWMVVGAPTFTDDLLRRLGVDNPFRDLPSRYPTVTLSDLRSADVDVVLLPDEPYPFTAADGPEALADLPTALVSGRLLTWYGPSLVSAPSVLSRVLQEHTRSR